MIQGLADDLQPQFGIRFSRSQSYWYVEFYRDFSIVSAVRTQLSWTHYRTLISIDNDDKREFYIAEATKNNWSARELERQINSQLFERLLLSNDVASVLQVARNRKRLDKPRDIIKGPMVSEFLGLKRESVYYEKDLESALIASKYQLYLPTKQQLIEEVKKEMKKLNFCNYLT